MKNMWKPKLISHILCLIILMLLFSSKTNSQALIRLNNGDQVLSITTGAAGGQLVSVVNTTATLTYRISKKEVRKVTVMTSCLGQKFSLSVLPTGVTQGTPASTAINLINGNPAIDFITNTPKKNGNATATLQYTASATFNQGCSAEVGDDVHTVTYTLQVQ